VLGEKTGSVASVSRAPEPAEPNPLDFVPNKIPFDTPYGAPISLERLVNTRLAPDVEAGAGWMRAAPRSGGPPRKMRSKR